MHNIIKSKRDDTTVLMIAFSVLLFSHIWQLPSKIWIITELIFGMFLFFRHIANAKFSINVKDLFIPLFATILFMFSYMLVGNERLEEHIISMVFYFPIALTLLKENYNSKKMYNFAVIINIFLLIYILIAGHDRVFYDVSHNLISVFLLVVDAPIFLNFNKKENDNLGRQVIVSILGFISAVLSIGRGGILCMGLLMIFSIFNIIFSKSSKITAWKLITFICVIAAVAYVVVNPDILQIILARFFERKDVATVEEPRYIMNIEYLNQLNGIKDWVFGVNLSECRMISMYGKNPHNSLIGIHSNYGFVWLMLCVFGICKAIKCALKQKTWPCFAFVLVVVIRSLLDLTAGVGPFDILIFSWLMLDHRKVENK